MKTVTVEQMRELDRRTIEEYGTSGFVLMERAGFGAGEEIVDFISKFKEKHTRRAIVLCGKGNNGGDGYVVARYLYEYTDMDLAVYSVCPIEELDGDSKKHALMIAENVDVVVKKELSRNDFRRGDIVIDALLGTGAKGAPRPPYDNWISVVNSLFLPVVSLDIPSGMDGDTGQSALGITADLTVAMGLPKVGLALGKDADKCGVLKIADIGIPEKYIENIKSEIDAFTAQDAYDIIGRIPMNSHKNSVGSVLIIGGSADYFGAPFLAAASALRCGAGIVRVAVPESVDFNCDVKAVIAKRIKANKDGFFCKESSADIVKLMKKSDVVVVGPGLGTHRDLTLFLAELLNSEKPLIIDADALNIIAEAPEIYQEKDANILTPHPGEMSRLLKAFNLENIKNSGRAANAAALSEVVDATIVLKGYRTIIASPDGRITVNLSGGPALATAGSGDCLSGAIAAFAAKTNDFYQAAAVAVFIHGLAGEIMSCGVRGLIADDLPRLMSEAIRTITPFA